MNTQATFAFDSDTFDLPKGTNEDEPPAAAIPDTVIEQLNAADESLGAELDRIHEIMSGKGKQGSNLIVELQWDKQKGAFA